MAEAKRYYRVRYDTEDGPKYLTAQFTYGRGNVPLRGAAGCAYTYTDEVEAERAMESVAHLYGFGEVEEFLLDSKAGWPAVVPARAKGADARPAWERDQETVPGFVKDDGGAKLGERISRAECIELSARTLLAELDEPVENAGAERWRAIDMAAERLREALEGGGK